MNFLQLAALPVLAGALTAPAEGVSSERNFWPLVVERRSSDANQGSAGIESADFVGPLGFYKAGTDAVTSAGGVRPLYIERRRENGKIAESHFIYPLFSYRRQTDGHRWSVLNLINRSVVDHARDPRRTAETRFDLWPFYFSRQSSIEGDSYRAVFPLAGSIPHRFGQDRMSWVLFPLYGRFEKQGATTVTAPWPLVKVLSGDGHHGFELWPLFGFQEKDRAYRNRYYLWPLAYRNEKFEEGRRTGSQVALLPFYARDEAPGYRSETYVWPFFGYVDRTLPYHYHARHYLWPLWVQGVGDNRLVNRWAPLYSHSLIKGTDKTWVLWPLWRQSSWVDGALEHNRSQFLYFLYNSNRQRSAVSPATEAASKVHLWPFLSSWNNGAGRRQWQTLSPFEVFFPNNDPVRLGWSPLFALYRFEQTQPGDTRHVALWNAISYERSKSTRETSFHLGPLVSVETSVARGRVAMLMGLIAWQRKAAGTGWKLRLGNPATPGP